MKRHHNQHHRKPSSIGGTDEPENLSLVPMAKHEAWHILFSNCTAEEIAFIINATWLDMDYEFIVQRRPK